MLKHVGTAVTSRFFNSYVESVDNVDIGKFSIYIDPQLYRTTLPDEGEDKSAPREKKKSVKISQIGEDKSAPRKVGTRKLPPQLPPFSFHVVHKYIYY